jgi:hypothetical protein
MPLHGYRCNVVAYSSDIGPVLQRRLLTIASESCFKFTRFPITQFCILKPAIIVAVGLAPARFFLGKRPFNEMLSCVWDTTWLNSGWNRLCPFGNLPLQVVVLPKYESSHNPGYLSEIAAKQRLRILIEP